MNLNYAPGIPGYGMIGPASSDGLSGLAFFITDLNGITNTFQLKNKILSNENLILLNTGKIPGFPKRLYQNGDLFIDSTSQMFVIDFSNANLYDSTGVSFANTSFFYQGIDTPAINFQRYYNISPLGAGKLVDTIYSNQSPLDYAETITELYGLGSADFNSIQYTGSSLTPSNINPFGIWIGNVDPIAPQDQNAIALVRETTNNTWHFGNLSFPTNTQRANTLQLDFAATNVYGLLTSVEPNSLGNIAGNYHLINSTRGFSSGNSIQNNKWLVRNSNGTDWTTTKLHDGMSIDNSYV